MQHTSWKRWWPVAAMFLGATAYDGGRGRDVETEAEAHDNRQTALPDGRATLRIALRAVTWHPEGSAGPTLKVWAFEAERDVPRIPGPLLRRAQGAAPVRLEFVSELPDTVDLHGFTTSDAPLVVAPGARVSTTLRFDKAGNRLYWAARHGTAFDSRGWEDGQLTGAIVVDAPNEVGRADRVLVVTESFTFDSVNGREEIKAQLALNGRSWPYTERMTYAVNDSVRWRFLNGATVPHPMHLHGFYYRVTRRGNSTADDAIAAARQPLVVTDFVPPGHSMSLAFQPHEPGNWVFHCHFATHVNAVSSADTAYRHVERTRGYTPDGRHMGGLVMAFTVTSPTEINRGPAARQLHLVIDKKGEPFYHGGSGFSFALADSAQQVLPASARRVPGPLLLLRRNERVAITLHNRLDRATSVHWHGLEIESYPDGVPHVSGQGSRVLHPVLAHDSLTVTFTPPRTGTFMYHSHFSEAEQMNGGLYGVILVLDDLAAYDASRDHVLVIGGGGVPDVPMGFESPWALVNGRRFPRPVVMRVGETHRLRLASIHPDWQIRATLGTEEAAWQWQPAAKDGADLPAALRVPTAATWAAGPGETADFLVTPKAAGQFRLLVRSEDSGWMIRVPVEVKPR